MDKMDIVIQGKYDTDSNEVVASYLELPFVNNIIISCWDDNSLPARFGSDRVELIRSKYPPSPGTDNRNLQITSSLVGLRATSTEYAAKMRSDQLYTKESMMLMYKIFKERHHRNAIFVAGMFPGLLFHPRDHIFWGQRDNLIALFDVPLEVNGIAERLNLTKYQLPYHYSEFVRSETYLGANYISKFEPEVQKYVEQPENYLYDNAPLWKEAKKTSDRITNKYFKAFPREGINLSWMRKGWSEYPYDNQRAVYGERWAEDFIGTNSPILNQALSMYAMDTENADRNFTVGLLYENMGQTAAAISFFLRAAERATNENLAYECMLKVGLCLDRQGNRGNSVRGAYKHAVCILPKRPEAYFLLARYYERTQDHVDAYTTAELGLQFADFNQVPLKSNVEYPGKYGLIFQKMVSSWWWGKPKECRQLLQVLKNEYGSKMDPTHYFATQNNLMKLGSGPESQAFRPYNVAQYPNLRFKFNGSEKVTKNYAQVYQDLFILSVLNGKRGGTYLEIGAAGPFLGNNTALLEQSFDWTGVGIEYDIKFIKEYKSNRKNPILHQDALTTDYDQVLSTIAIDGVVDYLQLDCEPAKATYDILLKIPFDKYKFAVITYEHDHYVDMTGLYRQASRDYLKSKGYKLIVNDISPDGASSFEDWWVHPELIDPEIMRVMTDDSIGVKAVADYMFPR